MSKILIVGNGFDLRHFLPTKYNHFICLLREIEAKNITNDLSFEEFFGNEFKNYDLFFYEKIKDFYYTDRLLFLKEELDGIKTKLKNNLWYRHFKSIDDSHIETWIDFETEINKVLVVIVRLFHTLDEIIKGDGKSFNGIFLNNKNSSYPYHFESLLSKRLLINLEIFKNIMGTDYLNEEYYFKIENKIQFIHENKILNNLYISLQEFTGIFNDFFLLIVSKFYNLFREERKENFLQKDEGSFEKLLSKIDKIYSFNYTETIERLYLPKEIDFLHGKVVENWINLEELKIVLGVDDLDQNLKKHKLFNFTKYFQKLHKQTDYQFLHNIYRMEAHTFYFWGHSLDISDKEYIREVFDQLHEKKSNLHDRFALDSRIVIFYHSIQSKGDQINNLLSIIGKDEIEQLMKQKRLTFIQATEENLFKVLLKN